MNSKSQVSSPKSPASDSDVLIRAEGVSKKFCLSLKKSLWYGLCDMGRELTGRRHGVAHPSSGSQLPGSGLQSPVSDADLRPKEFWAIHDVNFELKRGECLGLIGRNGAGKTTLLKMLNGLIKPDAGRIEMRGRVGALIALGAGFNPILTGRENIYVNASVLGISKRETDAKLDEIIDFAEIGKFIDTPVQNYSSGMVVRLGFSVASSLKPDILLADEVLAVGDAGFRAKCYRRLSVLLKAGVSVIFVSHEIVNIQRLCQTCLWLRDGQVAEYGEMEPVTSQYNIWLDQSAKPGIGQDQELENKSRLTGAKILDVRVVTRDGSETNQIETGKELRIRLTYEVTRKIPGLNVSLSLRTREEALYNAYVTLFDGLTLKTTPGRSYIDLVFPELPLGAGEYWISAGLPDKENVGFYDWNWNALKIQIVSHKVLFGRFSLPHRWESPSVITD